MSRDSIHISMSEPLRRAQVRPRLQSLAKATGLPVAIVAARALTIGLGPLEGDLRLIFPAAVVPTAPTDAGASDTAPSAEPPSITASYNVPPQTTATADAPRHDTATADAPPQATAPTADSQHDTAPRAEALQDPPPVVAKQESAPPRTEPPALVTAKVAAAALGHASASAFAQHRHRNPEIKRCSQKVGTLQLWDLAKLRAVYAGKDWQLKRAPRSAARRR